MLSCLCTHSQAGSCDLALHSFIDSELVMLSWLALIHKRELRCSLGFALIHRLGACDALLALHSFTGGEQRCSLGFALIHRL